MYKRLTRFISVLALTIAVPFGTIGMAAAEGNVTLTPSSSSAVADGSSVITFTIKNSAQYGYGYWCITVTGSGNTIGGIPANINGDCVQGDAGGNASFTLKSTVAESKTISLKTEDADPVAASASVKFTAKPVAVQQPTTTQNPTPTETAAPSAPTVSTTKVDGADKDIDEAITVDSSKPLELSGKTVPNGVVTLTIHSTPKTVTTTADADGNWSYTITGLEAGKHTVFATVTDPVTDKTSDRATLLKFTVTAAKGAAPSSSKPTEKGNALPYIAGAVLLAVILAGALLWFIRSRKNHRHVTSPVVHSPTMEDSPEKPLGTNDAETTSPSDTTPTDPKL